MIKEFIASLFGKSKNKAQLDREHEIDYRLKYRDLERQTAKLKNDAEKCKQEARVYELNGNHAKAVSKAAEAQNLLKTRDSIMKDMLTIENSHSLSKQYDSIRKANEALIGLANGIIDESGVEEMPDIEAKRAETLLKLDERAEQMQAYVEGVNAEGENAGLNVAGEEALAAIMQEMQPAPAAAEAAVPEAAPVETPEWAAEQRRNLKQIIAE